MSSMLIFDEHEAYLACHNILEWCVLFVSLSIHIACLSHSASLEHTSSTLARNMQVATVYTPLR